MMTPGVAKRTAEKFIPISLESLQTDTTLDFDLYIKVDRQHVLYRARNMPFSDKARQLLLEHDVRDLYVSSLARDGYQKYVESHIKDILADESVPETTRTTILYDTAKMLVMDVMDKPTDPEKIERSASLVESTVMHTLMNRNAFHNILRVMAFDYSIYTHSVNVCTFSIALAQASGTDNAAELGRLGVGALLHDIGKTRVPEAILNKRGPLTSEEWRLIEKHPQWGFEIVLESDVIPHESHYPILQHHERENGSGYPHRLKAEQIHPFSKIVAIADVFDAMTTQRAYRGAAESYPALKEMHQDKESFNQRLLRTFTRMMGS